MYEVGGWDVGGFASDVVQMIDEGIGIK